MRKELAQYKSAASSSTAVIPVTDEGFSFLEVENAKLRQELDVVRRSGTSTSTRGRGRGSRGRGRVAQDVVEERSTPAARGRSRTPRSIEEARTLSTLETQVYQLNAKDRALSEMSKKILTLEDQLTATKSALENKDIFAKSLHEQLERLTFQFHKQPREFWMAGYNEALFHLDARIHNATNEGYKQG